MSIGPWQIVLILLIVVIIFGAGKLPKVAGDLAKGIKNFKAGLKEEAGTGEESAPVAKSEAAAEDSAAAASPKKDTAAKT